MDRNRLIGSDGKIPWHLPADLKHFREITLGHPVIMGRKTHESIGTPLDGRLNIILTRDRKYETFDECEVVHSRDTAEQKAKGADSDELMVIGGESIYEMYLPGAEVLYLTLVHGEFQGDVYFPKFDPRNWTITRVEDHHADENNPHDYSFYTLVRNETSKRNSGKSKFPEPDFLN